MFGLGPLEMVIILAAALVFIGPGKLPDVARSLGKGMREMRRAVAGFEGDIQRATTPLDESETKAPPVPDPDSHEGLFPPDDPRAAKVSREGDSGSEPADEDVQGTEEESEPGPRDRVAQVQARPVRPATDDEPEETSEDVSATEDDVSTTEDRADTPEPV